MLCGEVRCQHPKVNHITGGDKVLLLSVSVSTSTYPCTHGLDFLSFPKSLKISILFCARMVPSFQTTNFRGLAYLH